MMGRRRREEEKSKGEGKGEGRRSPTFYQIKPSTAPLQESLKL
jgi:hypothetical protein